MESFRPLLPVGYASVAQAYRAAVEQLTAHDLTTHYTDGLEFFHGRFVPHLKQVLAELSGGVWSLDDFDAYAAGSDVDLMTHVVEAVAARESVSLYPGDWFGFRVGSTHPDRIHWQTRANEGLACLCIPSVRNGHVSGDLLAFLDSAPACLLNLNLYPTLADDERRTVAEELQPLLPKSLLSISFSRGFGLTASQLGVMLVPRHHPYRARFAQTWEWFTYFYNGLAARAFMQLDPAELQTIDTARRRWVHDWLAANQLPVVSTGSYYVKSFLVDGPLPDYLRPLCRDGLVRLCFKPPQI